MKLILLVVILITFKCLLEHSTTIIPMVEKTMQDKAAK